MCVHTQRVKIENNKFFDYAADCNYQMKVQTRGGNLKKLFEFNPTIKN